TAEDAADEDDEPVVQTIEAEAAPVTSGVADARSAGSARADEDEDARAVEGQARALDPARVRSLLAGLSVQPRADGGLVLEADRESAAVLVEVLRGLASAIEGAASGGVR